MNKRIFSTMVCGVFLLSLATSSTVAAPPHKFPRYDPPNPTFTKIRIVEPIKNLTRGPTPRGIVEEPEPPVSVKSFDYSPNTSWYGPKFYCIHPTKEGCIRSGNTIWLNKTACGQLYTKNIIGVAHRTLPCGTEVIFKWKDIEIRTTVIDRGPYVAGRIWDLSGGLCTALDHCFTGPIYYKVVK